MILKTKKIKIRFPDDWHVHLRDGKILQAVLPYTINFFRRALIMPNLSPPITTILQSENYRNKILSYLPDKHNFQPLMTCYLDINTDKYTLINGYKKNAFFAAKFYVNHIKGNVKKYILDMYNIFDVMQEIQMPLLIHGEVIGDNIDVFDQERFFIENFLEDIHLKFPCLKIVLEHISTKEAAEYVISGNCYIGATITPQHLILDRNHMFKDGLNPYLYCVPVLKRKLHSKALQNALKTGCHRFFLGTDTAPHIISNKESCKIYPGIFNAPFALEIYASIFEEIGALNYFENFCSINGPKFYNLPLNEEFISLYRLNTTDDNINNINYINLKIPNFNYDIKWRIFN